MLSFLLFFFEMLHWGILCVFVTCGLGSCAAFFESNMAVCLKQVDAAQKFVRGIRVLPSYCNFADGTASVVVMHI